jgi:hypothetical protein
MVTSENNPPPAISNAPPPPPPPLIAVSIGTSATYVIASTPDPVNIESNDEVNLEHNNQLNSVQSNATDAHTDLFNSIKNAKLSNLKIVIFI